jgi:hypothetical protein
LFWRKIEMNIAISIDWSSSLLCPVTGSLKTERSMQNIFFRNTTRASEIAGFS